MKLLYHDCIERKSNKNMRALVATSFLCVENFPRRFLNIPTSCVLSNFSQIGTYFTTPPLFKPTYFHIFEQFLYILRQLIKLSAFYTFQDKKRRYRSLSYSIGYGESHLKIHLKMGFEKGTLIIKKEMLKTVKPFNNFYNCILIN